MALKKINRFLGRYAKGMQFFTSSPYITRISSKMVQVPPGWSKYVFQTFFFHVAEMLHSRETLIGRALINRGLIGPKSIFVLFQRASFFSIQMFFYNMFSCVSTFLKNVFKCAYVINGSSHMNIFSPKLKSMLFKIFLFLCCRFRTVSSTDFFNTRQTLFFL